MEQLYKNVSRGKLLLFLLSGILNLGLHLRIYLQCISYADPTY